MRHERPAKREEEGGVKGGQGQEDEYSAWDGGGGGNGLGSWAFPHSIPTCPSAPFDSSPQSCQKEKKPNRACPLPSTAQMLSIPPRPHAGANCSGS